MSKYLHLSLDMRSDIEVMLAKKFSFNRVVSLSLHVYATDAKIETSAAWGKRFYRAKEADNRYRKTLSEARTGVNITEEEIKHLDGIVSPLLVKGQSIRHIFNNHSDEIMISDKTLYSYVNNSLFTARNIDMSHTVGMSTRKKNKSMTLKIDKDCRNSRTYSLLFLETTMKPGRLHIYLKSSTLSSDRTFLEKYSMYCSLMTEVSSQILKHLSTISILILERRLKTRALTIFLHFNMTKKY